ncbi:MULTISPECIES: hypothetical protein [Bacteria]|nr:MULTISPECIES: hypothetical protein [Terrabacteria group]KAF2411452.1 hypothetical protein B1729_20255 [Microbacterium sp. B35-04]HDM0816759.1 hypothetical protein [Staphylococcus aureus]
MIYIVSFLILALIISTIYFYNNLKQKLLDLQGIPVSLPFPYEQFNLTENKNYIFCLSTQCPHCNKIVDELLNLNYKTNNVYIIFIEDEVTLDKYLKTKGSLNFEIIKDIKWEELFISQTPFTYILNEKGIIIEKGIIKNTKLLDIY